MDERERIVAEENATKRMSEAKVMAVMRYPFFATVLLQLKDEIDWAVPTMATDSVKLLYNPSFVVELKTPELCGVMYHEALHVALEHCFRRFGRDPVVWNIACDYAVNPLLIKDNVVLPEGCLLSDKYKDMTAESIYDDLMKQADPKKANGKMIGEARDYKQGGDSGDAVASGDDPSSGEGSQQQGSGDYDKSLDEQAQDWKMKIAAAAMTAKQAGNLPGYLDRIVGKLLNPQLPWKELLSRFLTERAKDDYSWQRPNKRYLYGGMYLPSLDSISLKKIGIIVDTSGSISDSLIQEFASEILAIMSIIPGTTAEIVWVDTRVNGAQELTAETIDTLKPIGGGGTDFRPGFKYFKEKNEELACIVYFTDGECNSFPSEEENDTMWVVHGGMEDFSPPFGEVVVMRS